MSISTKPRYRVAQGDPVLFWVNRDEIDPFTVSQVTTAHSGKAAIVKKDLNSSLKGKPMIVGFRVARRAHVEAWRTLMNATSAFNTTSLATYFSTGRTVLFNPQQLIKVRNEIIGDYDFYQDIFDSTSENYKKGFDYWMGTLHLIIMS